MIGHDNKSGEKIRKSLISMMVISLLILVGVGILLTAFMFVSWMKVKQFHGK